MASLFKGFKEIISYIAVRNYAKSDIGNCAVVTGGCSGIGFTACQYLLQAGVMVSIIIS